MAPIRMVLQHPDNTARLQEILASESFLSQAEFGRRVCDVFGFRDALGRLREISCTAALVAMERKGHIAALPKRAATSPALPRRPVCLDAPVPAPINVPARVDLVQGLHLVRVADEKHKRLYNTLMQHEHACGAVLHAGCQMRYLIASDHGWLGGVGFAAPALRLKARDAYIGWDEATREGAVQNLVGLSRFLLRTPPMGCHNLASKVLSLALRQMQMDFMTQYGRRPRLVETFVDEASHTGGSLAASGWRRVGETAGLGRFAEPKTDTHRKAVWVRPLVRNWRRALGVGPRIVPMACSEGLDQSHWCEQEFGNAPLGDKRLSKRLVMSASIAARAPTEPFTLAAEGDRALIAGHYRMIDRPADSAVTPEAILAPHRGQTQRRMADRRTVLLLEDGSDVNFATHQACEGLGVIARRKGSSGTLGVHMHSTLAVGTDGLALGVTRIEYDRPDGQAETGRPLEERKSARWLRGLRDSSQLLSELDGVRGVSVMDREGDFFALFAERERLGNIDILVRARYNRALGSGLPKLFDTVRASPVQDHFEMDVLRASARKAAGTQKKKALREARVARMALRWCEVSLPATEEHTAAPITLSVVQAVEERPAGDGIKPLEWILLTSLPVRTAGDAHDILTWYRFRWRIEEWHRILKSGCKIEESKFGTCDGIERMITINGVIAWRLLLLMQLGREIPELPPEHLYSDTEIMALSDFATRRELKQPTTLGQAVLLTAIIGGYVTRKTPPGSTTLWRGLTRLMTYADVYDQVLNLKTKSKLHERLCPD